MWSPWLPRVDTITSVTVVIPRDPINHHSTLFHTCATLNSKSVLEGKSVWRCMWEGWVEVQCTSLQYLDNRSMWIISYTTGRCTPPPPCLKCPSLFTRLSGRPQPMKGKTFLCLPRVETNFSHSTAQSRFPNHAARQFILCGPHTAFILITEYTRYRVKDLCFNFNILTFCHRQ
jgi:hypothetical protein